MKILPEKETVWSWLCKSAQTLWTIFELPPMENEDPYPKNRSLLSKIDENSVVSIWSDDAKEKCFRHPSFDDSSLPDLRSIDDTLN